MPKGFLVRRRRSHAPSAWRRYCEEQEQTTVKTCLHHHGTNYVTPTPTYELHLSYPLNLSTTRLEDVKGIPSADTHRIITDLTPPCSPVPSPLATLLAGPPLYRFPLPNNTTNEPTRTADTTNVPVDTLHTPAEPVTTTAISEPVTARHSKESRGDNEALKVVCRGDIDPSLNFVEATPEAKAELGKIENLIGAYICRLCTSHFDDAFQLAVHKCEKIEYLEYACPDCSKVFQYAAHLASHRRWHKPRSGTKKSDAGAKSGDAGTTTTDAGAKTGDVGTVTTNADANTGDACTTTEDAGAKHGGS